MFIPNKTYLAMKTGIFGVILVLLLIIVVQNVLYTTHVTKHNSKIEQLTTKIDSLEVTHSTAQLSSDVKKIQRTLSSTKHKINVLTNVQCATVPHDVDKRLLQICPP